MFVLGVLLFVYFISDRRAYRRETPRDGALDETVVQRVRVIGNVNFVWQVI